MGDQLAILFLFIPVQPSLEKDKIEALRKAQTQLATMLEESGVTEDEIVAEFNNLRKENQDQL